MPTRDNPHKRPRTIDGMIHTDANIAHQMEVLQPVCQPNRNLDLKDSIKECEVLATKILITGVILKFTAREQCMFTKNLNEVNKVRSQCNVLLLPTNILRKKKKCKKLLPVGNIMYEGTDLTWDETLCQYR